jgi:hypothetical protein
MPRKPLCSALALVLGLCAVGQVAAQKLEHPKALEIGDTAVWSYVLKGTALPFEERVVAVTDTEIRSTLRVGDRTFDAAVATRDFSSLRGMSLASGEANVYSAPYAWFEFPLEAGKAWSGKTTSTEASYTCTLSYQTTVDGTERVTVPAGQFDAFKLSGTEFIKCISKYGAPNLATSKYSYWVASVKDKVVMVKNEYHDSFGRSWSRELVSVDFK